MNPSPYPLAGITVVSLEQAVAAPFASRQLADLGARVIKIERPAQGDFARAYDQTVKGLASHFVWLNRSKESLVLNLKDDVAQQALRRLIDRAEVFIQNLAPGAAQRLGLDAERLHASNPKLIVCDISGYGAEGPYRDKKAYDLLIQCEAGLLSVTGTPETPVKTGISTADIAAGMYAYSGILTALFRRERERCGAHLQVSLFDALAEWMGYPAYFTAYGGCAPARTGASHAAIMPYGPFKTRTGQWVVLGVQNEREWESFCLNVLKKPALVGDPRFCNNSARLENREILQSIIEDATTTFEPQALVDLLDQSAIANGRINDLEQFWAHPQLASRQRWQQVQTEAGPIRALLPPAILNDHQTRLDPVPAVGEHSESILRELGYDSNTLAALLQTSAPTQNTST